MTKKVVLRTHTGLGDHFITNGMVHAYTDVYDKVYVPYIKMFRESIQCLYKGYEDKIEIVELPNIDVTLHGMHLIHDLVKKTNSTLVQISDPYLYYPRKLIINQKGEAEWVHVATNFDRQFYDLAGLHFSMRYTKARVPLKTDRSTEIYNQLSEGKDYILMHRASSQSEGYPLQLDKVTKNKDLPIIEIKPGITNNVIDFIELILNAKEIHAVGSFFQCVVDSVHKHVKGDLFFHNIMKKHDTQVNCLWNDNCWNIIDYDRKF